VVNCIILGRAEAFACRNNVLPLHPRRPWHGPWASPLALIVLATIREILGAGTWMNIPVLPQAYRDNPLLVAILAPGAFITMGLLMGLMKKFKSKSA
jgi:electron transport complex protein RnfE